MAKQPPPLDDALRAKFAAAREADAEADRSEPRARDAWYEAQSGLVHVLLKSGASFAFPATMFPELQGRTPHELRALEISPSGDGLHWDDIDVHIETAGVLVEMLGASMYRAFASVGGKARTERKAAAARANGAKGGRPRKQPTQQPEGHRYRPNPTAGLMKVAEVRNDKPTPPAKDRRGPE
jgi:hypothetical protein